MRYHQRHLVKYVLVSSLFFLLAGFYLWQVFVFPKDVVKPQLVEQVVSLGDESNFIDDLGVDILVNQSGLIKISEKYSYNFAKPQKFSRIIKTGFQKFGAIYNLPLTIEQATISGQIKTDFIQQKNKSDYSLVSQNDISGSGKIVIEYNLGRLVNSYDDFQDLVWPILGQNFAWPINRTGVVLHLPNDLASGNITADCHLISSDFNTENCLVTTVSQQRIGLAYFSVLKPGQDLLVSFSWPGQAVAGASIWLLIKDNYFIVWPLLTILLMFLIWLFHGRDLMGQKPSHKPEIMDLLTPAEAGFLIDERIDRRDLATIFLSLAKNGCIKIIELESSWQLVKLKDFSDLRSWEKILANQLFGADTRVSTTEIKNWLSLAQVWLSAKTALIQSMIERKFFGQSPARVRQVYTVLGFMVCLLSPAVFLANTGWLNSIAVFLSGFIIIAFGQLMPRKLAAGTALAQDLKAFELHLRGLTYHNRNQGQIQLVDPKTWQDLLVFALVLGFKKDFCRHFICQPLVTPNWYESKNIPSSSQDLTNRIFGFYQTIIKLLP